MKTIKISALACVLALMSFTILPTKTNESRIEIGASPISWKSEAIDVGQIPQGKPKPIEFEFKNTGKVDVIITKVKGSCGCTTTDYTKDTIKPGETAKVNATFNAAKKGTFSKTVTVTISGEETPKVLSFKGTVI